MPKSSHIPESEIAHRVHNATGVGNTEQAMSQGTLTASEAWKALEHPGKELPEDAVNTDGSIDRKALAEDVRAQEQKDKSTSPADIDGMAQDLWTLGTAPTSAWAVGNLARAALRYRRAMNALPEDVFKVPDSELDKPTLTYDSPTGPVDEIEAGGTWGEDDASAARALFHRDSARESLLRNGLPEWAEGAGKLMGVAAAAGDVWTLLRPGSALDDRADAGFNLAGLGLTTETGAGLATDALIGSGLVAADASFGWVPVVGWGLVTVTAGYELWKHRKAVEHFATKTMPNLVTKTVPHAFSSATHWISKHNPIHFW